MSDLPPCVLFEDEHLLVVNKPAGLNTHSPAPYAGEGLYDWLRHREPRWASLAIIHRLDKDTSGVLLFGKTALANHSLTRQFTQRGIEKKYLLLTDQPVPTNRFTAQSKLVRVGERYVSGSMAKGLEAETRFHVISRTQESGHTLLEAIPLTGRTHQIRVHAAERGFPILGDTLYGGSPFRRVCLHAAELSLAHPETGALMKFSASRDFNADPRLALREALIDPAITNAYRLAHGRSDGWPNWYVDRFGEFLLSASADQGGVGPAQEEQLRRWATRFGTKAVYHKQLSSQPGRLESSKASPRRISGPKAPEEVCIVENGVMFSLSFTEGYSVGLFLDQRDNRRRLLTRHIAAGFDLSQPEQGRAEVLNAFAYTCGFSACAAVAGARTTSLDLSRKNLEWGKSNFRLNQLDPGGHDFIYGDAFDWMRRLARKKREFDAVILDPPTFSRSREQGVFQAERDYHRLVASALPLLRKDAVLLACTNASDFRPEAFLASIVDAVSRAKREILQQQYFPQPPDFPISREEPAYLKTVWLRVR